MVGCGYGAPTPGRDGYRGLIKTHRDNKTNQFLRWGVEQYRRIGEFVQNNNYFIYYRFQMSSFGMIVGDDGTSSVRFYFCRYWWIFISADIDNRNGLPWFPNLLKSHKISMTVDVRRCFRVTYARNGYLSCVVALRWLLIIFHVDVTSLKDGYKAVLAAEWS